MSTGEATGGNTNRDTRRVAIVGGGLAGLSAAWYLSKSGLPVTLFEASSRLGGRARSFEERHIGCEVDTCQHIALGCCTQFFEFCRELQILPYFERHQTLYFVDTTGQIHRFCPSRWLFPPLHLLPAVAKLRFLRPADRWRLLRGMSRLWRASTKDFWSTMGEWLRANGQTAALVEHFWTPILISALSETLEYIPVVIARKVLVEGLLSTRDGYQLWTPTRPLSHIFDGEVSTRLATAGVAIVKGAVVKGIRQKDTSWTLCFASGEEQTFDGIVLAVPWRTAIRLLPPQLRESVFSGWVERLHPLSDAQDACAITGIHLWFDRPCLSLPHAILLGRHSQWVFRPHFGQKVPVQEAPDGRSALGVTGDRHACYYQIVVSASHRMPRLTVDEWLKVAVEDVKAVFPSAREARLLHGRVVTEPAAVLSPSEEWQRLRPAQMTRFVGLALAGDWTATGWPGTMESAVRSGLAAAQAMVQGLRQGKRL